MLSIVSASGCLLAADFWQSRPFTAWSEKDAARLLADSPWARRITISPGSAESAHGGDRRGARMEDNPTAMRPPDTQPTAEGTSPRARSAGDEATQASTPTIQIVIQWRSALPVKQALARMKFGPAAATSQEAEQFLSEPEPNYVIAILGLPGSPLPAQAARAGDAIKNSWKDHSTLIAARETEHPSEIEFRTGATTDVFLVFPRITQLSVDDKEVELVIRQPQLNIKQKFRLKEMVFNGRIEM